MTVHARGRVIIVMMLVALCAVGMTLVLDHDGVVDGTSATRHVGHLAGVWVTEYAEWFSAHHRSGR